MCNSRKQEIVTLRKLNRIIKKVKDIEKESAGNDNKKIMLYNKKWQNIENVTFLKKQQQHVSLNNDPNRWGKEEGRRVEFFYVLFKQWETLALIGYSCEDFPSRTTWSRLLLRNEEIRPNIWPEIPEDLGLWRRPACQTLSKALDISSATAQVAPDLLKALAILSDTTVKRSAIDQKDLKPYWKSWKKPHISLDDQQYIYLQVFQRLLITT